MDSRYFDLAAAVRELATIDLQVLGVGK